MPKPIPYRIEQKTQAQWDSLNPILPDGIVAFSTDTLDFRFGNGVDHYADLPVTQGESGTAGTPGEPGADAEGPTTFIQDAEPSLKAHGDLWLDGDDMTIFPTVPDGGEADQFLKKASSTDYDYAWYAIHEPPVGGSTNQLLRKTSSGDYTYDWQTVSLLPSGGSTKQALTKQSSSDQDVAWAAQTMYPFTRTYTSNQVDGIFAWLGTMGGKKFWSFPAKVAAELADPFNVGLVVTQSSNLDSIGIAEKAIDHNYNQATGCSHTQGIANSWWKADFGLGHTVTPTYVGILGRASGGQHPRNWKVQGSNDNTAWTDLLVVTGAGPNDGTWYSAAITGASAYRYLRILQTGSNSSGADYLVMGEIEFWGTVT